ncbi:putative quinol monooxygenase [uncultured Hymenobacter sp.]|uniref:putative quinol monooxygenase n=1 Tax=uncultured Hymenobacter sp. TaxID=170016 RepID=UPI0035CA8CA2
MTASVSGSAAAQSPATVVRIAKLHIKPAQLVSYTAALKEEIEVSVRLEPGVLNLYAVADKNDPAALTIFEVYASPEAYKAHLKTPHFKKYKTSTKDMIQSLELLETVPVVLEAKSK